MLLQRALNHAEQILSFVLQSRESLARTGLDVRTVISDLERVYRALIQLEHQYLGYLGVPNNYVRTVRLRLHKELASWKIWLPASLLAIAALVSFYILFDIPRWLKLELFRREIFMPHGFILIALVIMLLVTHEGLHALPFFLFVRNRPGFKLQLGFFGLCAYATANCLLSRKEYLIAVLTPLFGITILGVLLWVLLPAWGPWIYLFMSVNVAGAVGDLWIAWLLLRAYP